jgi:putative MFS transporter
MEKQALLNLENSQRLFIPERIERLPMTGFQRKCAAFIVIAWMFDTIDLGSMTFLLSPLKAEFQLTTTQAGLLGSMSFAGMFFGAMISGIVGDKWGRLKTLQISMLIWGTSGLLCAVATNVETLFLFRFLLGVGLGSELPVATAMLPELLPKTHRGRYVAIMEGLLPVGLIIAGLITYFVLPLVGWRWVFVIEALPAFWLIMIRRKLPESPRWLESIGYTQKAEETMVQMEKEVEIRYGKPLPDYVKTGLIEEQSSKAPLTELWSSRYWKRTLMLWIIWPFLLFGYYGLTTWLGSLLIEAGFTITSSITYVILITLGGIPGFLVASYLIEKIGRKPVASTAMVLTAISAYFYGHAGNLPSLIIWGFLLQFFVYAMWSSVYAYTPELYPTRMRATGCGMSSAIGRIGALLGPFVVGIVLVNYGVGAVFTMGSATFLISAAALLLLGPETKGKVLEELNY